MGNKTIADRLHDSYIIQDEVEDIIFEAFEKYEPEISGSLEFSIGSDNYDNSIEIYIETVIPYPYEPSWDVREVIYKLGFSNVFWNFIDEKGKSSEEIRGSEPRRIKSFKPEDNGIGITFGHIPIEGIGYVDDRFNRADWESKYKKPITNTTKK